MRRVGKPSVEGCLHVRPEGAVRLVVEYVGFVQVIIISRQVLDAQKLVTYLLGDLLERAVLINAYHVYFAVEVWGSLRLMLGPTVESSNPAQNPAEWSHVATEHVLTPVEVIIATRAIGAHSHAQYVGEPFELKPVAVDDRQWLPRYGFKPLQLVGYVDFEEVLHFFLIIFTFSGPREHRAVMLRFHCRVVLPR